MTDIGETIASIAAQQLGNGPCASTATGQGYYSSCTGANGSPEPWCADFVKWVWAQAGANVDGLTPAAGSFGTYGPLSSTPNVGDAALYEYNGNGYAAHVGIVVGVNSDGTFMQIAGDEGNHSSVATATVDQDGPYSPGIGSTTSGQSLSGFVSPQGGSGGPVSQGGNPYLPLAVDGQFGPLSTKALQWRLGVTADGDFGPVSIEALQRYLGVSADGQLGPITITALQAHVGAAQDGDWGPQTTTCLQQSLNNGTF